MWSHHKIENGFGPDIIELTNLKLKTPHYNLISELDCRKQLNSELTAILTGLCHRWPRENKLTVSLMWACCRKCQPKTELIFN